MVILKGFSCVVGATHDVLRYARVPLGIGHWRARDSCIAQGVGWEHSTLTCQ